MIKHKKGCDELKENTYYLFKYHDSTEYDYRKEREKYTRLGFHVVTFIEGPLESNLCDAIRTMIKNHL